jgi:ATP-dependent helicase HrpA
VLEILTSAIENPMSRKQVRIDKRPAVTYPDELLVSERREDIANRIKDYQVIIICGETSSGKRPRYPNCVCKWEEE